MTFLGYSFRPREAKNRRGEVFTSFPSGHKPEGKQSHRRTNSVLATASPKRCGIGGPVAAIQRLYSRLVHLLRPVLPHGPPTHHPTVESTADALGTTEIQTIPNPSGPGMAVVARAIAYRVMPIFLIYICELALCAAPM
jgi:hypothetical protein